MASTIVVSATAMLPAVMAFTMIVILVASMPMVVVAVSSGRGGSRE